MPVLLVAIPFLAGLIALGFSFKPEVGRWASLLALLSDFMIAIGFWIGTGSSQRQRWLAETRWEWIPQWGVQFHLGMDGLSLILTLLTVFLGGLAVLASWKSIRLRAGFFYFNIMFVLSGIIGVFLSLDLFLFYFFWELMLVPMYFLIAIWGHENRRYSALKFFVFTQASGLLMFLAILGLYYVHGSGSGEFTFDYERLLGTAMSSHVSLWLMLGFAIAFAVKLPVFPFHTWLPDAHTEAPTAGSIILAGLLLKTGGYGFLRFVLPLFPESAIAIAPVAMGLGVAGILYGSVMASAQTDLKRMVAYTSVSHLGFVLLGAFSGNELALQGAVLQMICHGLSTGALFYIVGAIQDRIHTRDIREMGGFQSFAPKMSAATLFFALASIGLPGLGNFVGEFLVLAGIFRHFPVFTALAALGLVFSTVYSLWLVQTTVHGEPRRESNFRDFTARELAMAGMMALVLVWLGIYPQNVLDTAKPALKGIIHEGR